MLKTDTRAVEPILYKPCIGLVKLPVVVKEQYVFAHVDEFGHDAVLRFADVLRLGLDDGVEEAQILHVTTVSLDAVDEMLHHLKDKLVALDKDAMTMY